MTPHVYYNIPWSSEKNLGKAYNEFAALVPEDGWICFMDADTMRDSKGKTVKDFFPMLFEDPDDDDREPAEPLSEEDYAYEQALMDNFNFGQPAPPKEADPAPPQPEEAPDES